MKNSHTHILPNLWRIDRCMAKVEVVRFFIRFLQYSKLAMMMVHIKGSSHGSDQSGKNLSIF